MITQRIIARTLNLDISTVNKILNRSANTTFRPQTIRKVHAAARRLGYDYSKLKFVHRRLCERVPADVPIRMRVVMRGDGTVFDEGRARIKDVSRRGARLGDCVFGRGVLPLQPFYLLLGLDGAQVPAYPMRLIPRDDPKDLMEFGVVFKDLDRAAEIAIRKLL